jgi:hypothetical protein
MPLLTPVCATCTAYLILLNLITQTIFGEQYRSLGSSLCFLHSPVTSSLLGPNILFSTLFSIMNIYFCLVNRPQAPIMYTNGTQLHKTVEILQYMLLLQSFFGQQTFQLSSLNQYILVQSQNGRVVVLLSNTNQFHATI